jgi:hypothetical protein
MPFFRKTAICLTAAALCAALFAGCAAKPAPTTVPEQSAEMAPESASAPVQTPTCAEPAGMPELNEDEFAPFCAYVGWTEYMDVLPYCLNGKIIAETMMLSSVRHLPVFLLDSSEALEGLRSGVGSVLQFDCGYNEASSFNELAEKWDKAFFEDKALVFAWVESGSGSFRFGFTGAEKADGVFRIYADRVNDPEVGTDDMAGWFVGVEVPKAALAGCTEFDALYGRPIE